MHQAFILGAGLGTRLRPLTDRVPKPLVPLFHRPLVAWAMDACNRVGIQRFAINTHHLPSCWANLMKQLPAECDVTFFHEPVLLETGGGLKNIGGWMGDDALLVHNGDIYSDMPLEKLVTAHQAIGRPVTLALRSHGDGKHISLNLAGDRVTDIRRRLGRADGTHVFTGIYCVNPEFLDRIPGGGKQSIIPPFLELADQGLLAAIVIDDGVWLDLGDRSSYLQAHRELQLGPAIHPDAEIHRSATVNSSVVGPGAVIGAGASIHNCIVWPGSTVSPAAALERCIVFSDHPASGHQQDQDL